MSFVTTTPEWTSATARELWGLGPNVAFLDHASWGCVPTPVRRGQSEWRQRAAEDPARYYRTDLPEAIDHARLAAATFCGAEAEDFGLLVTTGEAIEAVFNALSLAHGDEIVMTSHVEPRLKAVAARVAGRFGATVTTAKVPAMADLSAWESSILSAVTSRTRLVVLEQVTATTSELVPVQKLSRTLRANNLRVLVDGSQAVGMLGDSVARLGADVWIGAFHLWACAPLGAVGMWVDPSAGLRLQAPDTYLSGGVDLSAWCTLPTAFRFMRELDLPRLRANNAVMAAYGQTIVAEALYVPADRLPGHPRLSVRSVPLPAGVANTARRATELSARISSTLRSDVGAACMNGQGWLRLSAQAYNSAEEYDWLTYGLRDVIRSIRA